MQVCISSPAYLTTTSGGGGTLAFDALSSSTQDSTDLNWTHTPSGTPRGILVYIIQSVFLADHVASVMYGGTGGVGGVAMTEVTGSPLIKTTGENLGVYAYFLGTGIPTGPQEVFVDSTNTSQKRAFCLSFTAPGDTQVIDTTTISADVQASPINITLSLGGVSCVCSIGFMSGEDSVATIDPLSGWTSQIEHDFGVSTAAGIYTYNTVSTSDVTAGWSAGSSNDAVGIAVAIGNA